MIRVILCLLLSCQILFAQETASPIILGQQPLMLAPAVDAAGHGVAFGTSVSPEGASLTVMDLWTATVDGSGLRQLTRLVSEGQPPQGAIELALDAGGAHAAFTALLSRTDRAEEEVHVVDVATGADRVVAIDTEGCIQPLLADCPACFFTCIYRPHLNDDGTRVLYAARRNQPFYTVNADGTDLTQLPVYSGLLAPGPQRVISRSGLVVFASAAPFGPTFAPSATDVYVMNLDGTGIRAVTQLGNDASLYASNATISADGRTIAFESNLDPDTRSAGQLTHIWVVGSDGSGLRPLTANIVCLALNCPVPGGTSPSISGDGQFVSFVNGDRIVAVRSDGGNSRIVASFQQSAARDPVVSEDGSHIVFTIGPKNGGAGAIYSVRADGTELQPVYAPRALNQFGVVGIVPVTQPSPGSLFSAYGINLGPDSIQTAVQFPLPEALSDSSLLVNGEPVPLVTLTPWQINAQFPMDVPAGEPSFQLRFPDGTTAAVTAEVKAYSPAVFSYALGNTIQAAAFHANSSIPADSEHPATGGETLEIYATGLGVTQPFVAAGLPSPTPPAWTQAKPEVLIGNEPAQVLFSGLVPGLAAVYQVNAVVPQGMRPGQYVLRLRVGDSTSADFATIAVR